ncbi:carotenoid oxygenase family protein [soil metagenome]
MAAVSSSLDNYLRSNATVRDERDTTLRVTEGALPPELRGVLYRNGPGKMEVFGARYDHPFDGDGMVARLSFDGHAVHYRNRFVRTEEYAAEQRAGRMLYRSFGTNLPGGLARNFLRLRFKNAANTSVVLQGGKLLALWEGGQPHALDPVTLETLGRYDFDGQLRNRSGLLGRLLSPELPFSAHPKVDVDSGELFNFGTLMGPTSQLVSYRVRRDGTMAAPSFLRLPALSFVHDFVLTKRYCVYFLSAVSFGIARTVFGLTTPVGSLSATEDAPATLLLVPRDGSPPVTVPARPGFLFHFANGFEDAQGRIVLDGMRMDALPSAGEVRALLNGREVHIPPARPTRYVVNLAACTVVETRISETPADLPTIDPRRSGRSYRHFWSIAAEPDRRGPFYHRLMHFDHEGRETARDFGPDLPGEPLFVPASHDAPEGGGWVLSLVYRAAAHRTDLYVLRPDDLATVCRVELPHHLPSGFHGTWCAAPDVGPLQA